MDRKAIDAAYTMDDIPLTAEMIDAMEGRLGVISPDASTYLAEEAFQAGVKVAIYQGILQLVSSDDKPQ